MKFQCYALTQFFQTLLLLGVAASLAYPGDEDVEARGGLIGVGGLGHGVGVGGVGGAGLGYGGGLGAGYAHQAGASQGGFKEGASGFNQGSGRNHLLYYDLGIQGFTTQVRGTITFHALNKVGIPRFLSRY